MAIDDDMSNAATLCSNASDAALNKLIALGPRPSAGPAASTWDTQDALLKNKISTLNNLSSSISAAIVVDALKNVWPTLENLDDVTASARINIDTIAEISRAMVAVAAVINFGVAVITITTQPSPANAAKVVTAFKNLVTSIKTTTTTSG